MPCAGNLRKAWAALFALAKHAGGRSGIARAMRLCGGANSLNNEGDVMALALWAQSAWDYMAMVRNPSQAPNRCENDQFSTVPALPVLTLALWAESAWDYTAMVR